MIYKISLVEYQFFVSDSHLRKAKVATLGKAQSANLCGGFDRLNHRPRLSPNLGFVPRDFASQNLGTFGAKLQRYTYSVGRFFKFLLSAIALPSPTFCSIIARTLRGSPKRVMKPWASLWL